MRRSIVILAALLASCGGQRCAPPTPKLGHVAGGKLAQQFAAKGLKLGHWTSGRSGTVAGQPFEIIWYAYKPAPAPYGYFGVQGLAPAVCSAGGHCEPDYDGPESQLALRRLLAASNVN